MTTRPVRLQLSRRAGFDLQELSRRTNGLDAIAVTRPGPWGNPFKVEAGDRLKAVRRFRLWLCDTPEGRGVTDRAKAVLRGKNLACHCAPYAPCHADVLLEIANA